ncbi:MAG: hypothetical protein ABI702_10200 [Burkholderiales bacterium]
MQRDLQHDAPFRSRGRKEWAHSDDHEHQMEAREHARQHGKSHKAYGARSAEAERQIRELRARY